jgi:hypothetical protein
MAGANALACLTGHCGHVIVLDKDAASDFLLESNTLVS